MNTVPVTAPDRRLRKLRSLCKKAKPQKLEDFNNFSDRTYVITHHSINYFVEFKACHPEFLSSLSSYLFHRLTECRKDDKEGRGRGLGEILQTIPSFDVLFQSRTTLSFEYTDILLLF